MKYISTHVILTSFVALLFGLCSCQGTNESRGKQIGKKIDNCEKTLKDQVEKGKETAHDTKEKIKKKAHEAHENAKETAHEVINKS